MNKIRNTKGITLIALVITIILLLILAGIAITQLTQNGLLGKAKVLKEISNYTSAKEIVELKLMEVQVECKKEEKDYTIVEIAKSMILDKGITIEKYYDSIDNLKGIVVSVNQYSKYKFLIGEGCDIDRVTEKEIKEDTKIEEFETVEEFEERLLGTKPKDDNGDKKEENDINGYVKEGLILYLDGIDKKGKNNYEGISGKWYDLSDSHSNATLYNCIENDNNIEFNGSSSYATLPTKALGNYGASTIEIVSKIENKSVVIADNYSISGRGLGILDNNTFVTSVGGEQDANTHTTTLGIYSKQHTYAMLFNGTNHNTTDVYIDMQLATRNSDQNGFSNNTNYPIIGRRVWNTGSIWSLKGNIYAIRVYNRQLTQEELTQNYNIDKNRF